MVKSALLAVSSDPVLVDPFSKKGALALFWLLAERDAQGRPQKEGFSINQLARTLGIGLFTVHRVIRTLEYDGIIRAKGIGTKKRFLLAEPKALLIRWLRRYQIQSWSKLHRYALLDSKKFASNRDENLRSLLVPALHTGAGSIFQVGVTNLTSTEAYLINRVQLPQVIRKLGLVEQERGYEVLLIESYYSELIKRYSLGREDSNAESSLAILTFLDLYHFPIRGREQAEALYRKIPVLKSLGSWSDFENIEAI